MINYLIKFLSVFSFFLLLDFSTSAQSKRVELIKANSLEGVAYMGQPIRKLIGDVVFRHQGTLMYCDSSYQYELKNELEAFNHVKIIKSDSQSIKGDHMNYYGDTRLAKITGTNVILNNKSLYLYSTVLDYYMEDDVAKYYNKGTVIDKENKLISDIGSYYNKKDLFIFEQNVIFTDKKYTIYTDTLEYNTITKVVKFRGLTTIIGPDGLMNSDQGEYNSIKKTCDFKGRAVVNYQEFRLSADKLFYDQFKKAGVAVGNVVLYSKKDSITIYGDYANYWGDKGKTKIFPNALMQTVSNQGKDTLFLSSDTLLAINDTVKKEKKMFAYHRVKIFNKEMQAICDSLVNNIVDSTVTFYRDPVLWNGKNQMRGDTIKIVSKNKAIEKILFRNRSFSIMQDTVFNFNQVKGKHMIAWFLKNKINKIDVKLNSESIYYALSEDTITTGVNKVESENMQVRFLNSKVKNIAFYKKPKAKLIPKHELNPNDERLAGFKWRITERPDRKIVLGKYFNKISNLNKK